MYRIVVNLQSGEQSIIPYTDEEMTEYLVKKAEADATESTKAGLQAAYDQAAAVFSTLNLGKQALWEPVRKAVGDAILAGDMTTAKEILLTVPALYEGAETDRALFLSLFP